MRKRILFFGHRPYPNDHVVLETVFTRFFPAAGYDVTWILQPKTPEHGDLWTQWNDSDVYVLPNADRRGVQKHILLLLDYVRMGTPIVRDYSIDVVQARTGLPEALAAWWLAIRYRKPFVFQYSFSLTDSRREQLREAGLGWLAQIAYIFHLLLTYFLMRQAALTLAISDAMRDRWLARGVKKIVTFPLGADETIIPEHIEPVTAPPETLIYFGVMPRRRNLTILLDIFAYVLKKRPSAFFLLVGESIDSGLPQYAEQLSISHAVSFVGRVPRRDVPRYIRAARCSLALYPPRPQFLTVSPIKVMESLVMGVPVVGNEEIRDMREVLEASGGGLVRPYNVEALAEAVLELFENPLKAHEMGQAGRKYVLDNRSYTKLSEELLRHYEEFLDHPRGESS